MMRGSGKKHTIAICGSRNYENYQELSEVLNQLLHEVRVKKLLTGGCRGADEQAKRYAQKNGYKYKVLNANWQKLGKYAGLERNTRLAREANATIGFWDGKSRGTYDMLKKAVDHKHEYIAYWHTELKKLERLK
jgi:predicted Rossmann-fold nucleotide-binding protein